MAHFAASVDQAGRAGNFVRRLRYIFMDQRRLAIFGPNTDSVVDLLQTLLKYGYVVLTCVLSMLNISLSSTNVKRFIYMSSAQAMLGKPLTHIYTEVHCISSKAYYISIHKFSI